MSPLCCLSRSVKATLSHPESTREVPLISARVLRCVAHAYAVQTTAALMYTRAPGAQKGKGAAADPTARRNMNAISGEDSKLACPEPEFRSIFSTCLHLDIGARLSELNNRHYLSSHAQR